MEGALCPAKIYSMTEQEEHPHPLSFPPFFPSPPLINTEFSKISYSDRNKLWHYWTSLSFLWNTHIHTHIPQLNLWEREPRRGCVHRVWHKDCIVQLLKTKQIFWAQTCRCVKNKKGRKKKQEKKKRRRKGKGKKGQMHPLLILQIIFSTFQGAGDQMCFKDQLMVYI